MLFKLVIKLIIYINIIGTVAFAQNSQNQQKSNYMTCSNPIIKTALKLEKSNHLKTSRKLFDSVNISQVQFPTTFFESQKLSYRLNDWKTFFARQFLYTNSFRHQFICKKSQILFTLALIRHCRYSQGLEYLNTINSKRSKSDSKRSKIRHTCHDDYSERQFNTKIVILKKYILAQQKLKVDMSSGTTRTLGILDHKNLWKTDQKQIQGLLKNSKEKLYHQLKVKVKDLCSDTPS